MLKRKFGQRAPIKQTLKYRNKIAQNISRGFATVLGGTGTAASFNAANTKLRKQQANRARFMAMVRAQQIQREMMRQQSQPQQRYRQVRQAPTAMERIQEQFSQPEQPAQPDYSQYQQEQYEPQPQNYVDDQPSDTVVNNPQYSDRTHGGFFKPKEQFEEDASKKAMMGRSTILNSQDNIMAGRNPFFIPTQNEYGQVDESLRTQNVNPNGLGTDTGISNLRDRRRRI